MVHIVFSKKGREFRLPWVKKYPVTKGRAVITMKR
jgi:hypothetical protein